MFVLATSLDAANELALRIHCNVPKEDILYESWRTLDVYIPGKSFFVANQRRCMNLNLGHFLVVDKNKEVIIFGVRGTMSAADVCTDLISKSVPFKEGKAHQGILQAATKLYLSMKDELLNSLQRYPEYSLVICGHSLGGGVATLISILIHDGTCFLQVGQFE